VKYPGDLVSRSRKPDDLLSHVSRISRVYRLMSEPDRPKRKVSVVNNVPRDSFKRLAKLSPEAMWVLAGQLGVAFAGLAGVKLLTHVLPVSEFGKLSLANTVIGFISMNLFIPFGQGLMRFWSVSNARGELPLFYEASRRLARYICYAVLTADMIAFLTLNMIKNLEWSIIVSISVLIGIASGHANLRIGIFTAARQRKKTALLETGATLARPIGGVFMVLLIASSADVVLFGYLIVTTIVLVITELIYTQTLVGSNNDNIQPSRRLDKEIISYSIQFFMWQIFISIYLSCDKWAIQAYHGAEAVGAYAVVSQLAIYPLMFGSSFLHGLFLPIVYQKAGDLSNKVQRNSGFRTLSMMTGLYVLGAAALIGMFMKFHETFVLVMSNKRYVEFSYLLPILAGAWALFYYGQLLSGFGMLANKLKSFNWAKSISTVLAVGSTIYLVKTNGVSGVAWALLISGIVYGIWSSLVVFNLIKSSGHTDKE